MTIVVDNKYTKMYSINMENSIIDLLDTFKDDKACEQYFLEKRFANGVCCLYCKHDKVYKIQGVNKCQRYKCARCKKRFSALTGTIFESTKLGLRKWFLAFHLIQNSSKGISSIQLSKHLKITQRTAWFILHRFREVAEDKFQMVSGSVEIDETFIGGKEGNKHASKKLGYHGTEGKTAVMGAISRQDKQVVASPVKEVSYSSVEIFRKHNIAKGSIIYSDQCKAYRGQSDFKVHHSLKEFVRDGHIHTNCIESFWAILKRGYIGIYHWWSVKHLHRYINEFTFRFNHKQISLATLLEYTVNKRLKYRELTDG